MNSARYACSIGSLRFYIIYLVLVRNRHQIDTKLIADLIVQKMHDISVIRLSGGKVEPTVPGLPREELRKHMCLTGIPFGGRGSGFSPPPNF
jgi:hypothetical protein